MSQINSPPVDDVEIARRLALIVPPPEKRQPPRKALKWAVGIVAAPRGEGKVSYLTQCLLSVARAGFPRPWIFAEPGTPIPEGYDGPVTVNGDRLGVFPNYLQACWTLRHSQRTADCNAYVLMEDDVALARGLRRYLEDYACWPCCETQLAALCLFMHRLVPAPGPGWHRFRQGAPDMGGTWPTLWGAQALAYSKPGIDAWLASPLHCLHRENPVASMNWYADSELTRFSEAKSRPIYYAVGTEHDSLAAHMGYESSVFGGSNRFAGHKEATFVDVRTLKPTWVDPPANLTTRRAIQAAEENDVQRAERRLATCRVCPHWDAEEGCGACNQIALKPTPQNIGNAIGPRCKLQRWG